MIELLPEIQKLTDEQKLQLASELWDEVWIGAISTTEQDSAVIELLQNRQDRYEQGLEPTVSWEEIKRRLGKS